MIQQRYDIRGKFIFYLTAVLVTVLCPACVQPESGSYHDAATYQDAIYSEIANRSFTYEGPLRKPVIVIHGLLGAILTDSRNGDKVWGNFSYRSISQGSHFARLAHPMMQGKLLHQLQSEVRSSGVLERSAIQVLGMEFHLNNYDILLDVLKSNGYQEDVLPLPKEKHFASMFIFHYDWRRDISENARELARFIQEKKKYLQKRYEAIYQLKNYPVQFDLIGHSMGGLLARYYVLYGGKILPDREDTPFPVTWAGAPDVSKIIMIGTPNAGYVDTLLELNRGLRLTSTAPAYPKALIGTFVSYYQMLPDPSCRAVQYEDGSPVDYFSEKTWEHFRWGVLDPEQDDWLKILLPQVKDAQQRHAIVLDHLKKCLMRARQFKRALQPEKIPGQPAHLQFFLIAGDAVLTNQILEVNRKTGAVKVLKTETGDGKILASSAVFDRRSGRNWRWQMNSPISWNGVYFFQGGHMGIMNSPVFSSNLSYILTAMPSK